MSLPHALLTSLLERPNSGLGLARRFDRSIGFFWPASHQQIYRELRKLEMAGWVNSVAAEGARGRKRVYKVLPAGQTELARWVGECGDAMPVRDSLMVRLRAAAVLGTDVTVKNDLQYRLDKHRAQLVHYRAIEKQDFLDKKLNRAEKLQYLVLQSGIEVETGLVNFCENAIRLLSNS